MKMPLNIGILAHADAGKTTLTEQLLYKSDALKQLGQVDKGSSVSDTLQVEKNRGISVKTSSISFDYKGKSFNIIDTPGHIDFSSEVDRIFEILDLAIIVISAVEGIQGQTIRILECLKERKVPTLVFINKTDRIGANSEEVFHSIKTEFETPAFLINSTESNEPLYSLSLENLAEIQDEFMELFLDDNLPSEQNIQERVLSESINGNLFPTFIGSAKEEIGIKDLLEYLFCFDLKLIPKNQKSLFVYKVDYSTKNGIQYYVKNYGGLIAPKSKIEFNGKIITINELKKQNCSKLQSITELHFNDIAIVTFSEEIPLGSVLGENYIPQNTFYKNLSQDILKVEFVAKQDSDYRNLSEAFTILNFEDPNLNFDWNRDQKTFQISIQGEIQIEILQEILKNRFNIETVTKPIEIQYKETPKKSAEGYVRYWMPKPCWAIMTFLIEPGPTNSGLKYKSNVGVNDISTKYQNEIEKALPKSLKQGIKGWPITDIKITLIKGEEHQVHSNPGDFLLATPMGIMNGIAECDTELLEPMYKISMKFNSDLLGSIHSLLNKVDAQIENPIFTGDNVELACIAPVSKSLNFPVAFNSATSGNGRIMITLDSYQKTDCSPEKIVEYRGVNPLDTAQWILHNRGAYKADER